MQTPYTTSRFPIRDTLLPGTSVRARGLSWEVVHVEPAGEQLRYRLRCTQGDLRGREIDLLSPFEKVDPVSTSLNPKRAGRLQEWLLYHQAFLLEQALGPSALLSVQPGRLTIAPYQLVPVMRALSMTRPRLLLADGVGLGKTIEAGMIIAELIARRRAHRVLIVSPAGPLLQQWHSEMRVRFGLRFEAIRDWGSLQEKRRGLELGANPFDHAALCLLSLDFAKQEKVLIDLERTSWDLVVIDEAHHCVKLGGAGDNEDSRRRRLAEVLARQADGLLLLTATPHDGYDAHFASILELLDPSLVDGRGTLRADNYRKHVVRRLKHHIKDPQTGEPLFKTRVVIPRAVAFGTAEQPRFSALQAAMLAMIAPRLKAAMRKRSYGDVLAFISLLKRSVSTVSACKSTLEVVADRYADIIRKGSEEEEARKQRLRTLRDYQRRVDRYGALSVEEEADQAQLEAEDIASQLRDIEADELLKKLEELTHDLKKEQRRAKDKAKALDATHEALQQLVQLANDAESEDPKLARILAEIKAIREAEPRANVLVYSEYADSQAAVLATIKAALERKELEGEVLSIQGDDADAKRQAATERFQAEDGLVLVSTDATAEGLNLHERCHHLLHLELPYNPNRLEQRNGRIDRYGQNFDPVVRYLYLEGTFEERILLRLVAKYERQRARLTFVPNTLGVVVTDTEKLTERLIQGLAEEEGSLFKREAGSESLFTAHDENTSQPAYQELLSEIEHAIGNFEKSAKTHAWMSEIDLGVEASQVEKANAALRSGQSLGGFDLTRLVCEAVEAELRSGDAVKHDGDSVLVLRLPPAWVHGLDDVPGWDTEARVLRFTTDPKLTRDSEGRPLGFLGRAHPVVRRALDRVRNVPLGDPSAILDRRVTVVKGDGPAIVYTFLCTVRSEAGREFERVVAVRVRPDGDTTAWVNPVDWLSLATKERQTPSAGVWEKHFASWSAAREELARQAATPAFEAVAEQFLAGMTQEVAQERLELERWVAARALELCGERAAQLTLGMDAGLPKWKTEVGPIERLSAFSADVMEPPSKRQEAAGVVSLHRTRMQLLDRRAHTMIMPPFTLGMLLVVPEVLS